MKKELDITKIMDDYTDNEFGIEGEQAVDTEKAVGDLLAQVKPEKKKMKPIFKVLIAAAALVGLMGSTAANGVYFTTITGESNAYYIDENGMHHYESTSHLDGTEALARIVQLEDDRLYFVADGGKTDITDLIDEETPYIYKFHDLPTDKPNCENYIIVGGTPEQYGFISFVPTGSLSEEDYGELVGWSTTAVVTDNADNVMTDFQWYINGVEQLKSEGRLVNFRIEFYY